MSGTQYQTNHGFDGKLCDCLVFWSIDGADVVGAVELKAGGLSASSVIEQLQGGADVIDRVASRCRSLEFVPLVAHNGVKPLEVREFRRQKVTFRGTSYLAALKRCGTAFSTAAGTR
jgi:hypothetical protein